MTQQEHQSALALQLANANIRDLLTNLANASLQIEQLTVKLAEANAKLDKAPEPAIPEVAPPAS